MPEKVAEEVSGTPDPRWRLEGRDLLGLGIVTLVMVLPLWGLLHYQGPPMEEGFMLVFPEEILRGAVPHRDFLHLYGPGSIYALAAVYEVFGTHLYVERMVGFLQLSAVAYATWFLLRPFGRRIATSGAVVGAFIMLMPLGYAAMAWNGALAFGLCSLATLAAAWRQEDGTRRTVLLALGGVLGGMALLFRPDMVIGFAAETDDLKKHAKAKLKAKGADWILANDVSPETGVMGGDDNTIHLVTATGIETWPTMTKAEVAARLVERIAAAMGSGRR